MECMQEGHCSDCDEQQVMAFFAVGVRIVQVMMRIFVYPYVGRETHLLLQGRTAYYHR